MKITKISVLMLGLLAACGGQQELYKPMPVSYDVPADLLYGTYRGSDAEGGYSGRGKIAAVLPLSGKFASAGTGIQKAIEMAALKSKDAPVIEFFDSGADKEGAVKDALNSGSDIIIGPVFADEAMILRGRNYNRIPALTFTSDAEALGSGVYSIGIMPGQQAERIVKYAAAMGKNNMLILAPDSKQGRVLATASVAAADVYGVNIVGLYYHDENGSPDKLRELAKKVSLNKARNAANNEAKSIISDILSEGKISGSERDMLETELKARTQEDSLGALPYDSVLILSSGNDVKNIASFLRYYDVKANDVQFFGTAAWDSDDTRHDMILVGGAFPGMPVNMPEFANSYTALDGRAPFRMASMGYDAFMIASKVLGRGQKVEDVLRDPAGFKGADGIIRFGENGESERGLAIYKLNGLSKPMVSDLPPSSFMKPIYKVSKVPFLAGNLVDLPTMDIDPIDYINVPERLKGKWRRSHNSATAGAKMTGTNLIHAEDMSGEVIVEEDFSGSAMPEKIEQQLLDNVEIVEKPKAANKKKPAPVIKKKADAAKPAAPVALRSAAAAAKKPETKKGKTKTRPLPPKNDDYIDVDPM
ncbi:MAG: penicillin-binding protein activator [Rickettsiales bacterium]|jgi:ABC-type branched-subunit amino acid transport system substrate-binding protein|nr:penicillin-binding protein activator [Rickettsiales bacterium]